MYKTLNHKEKRKRKIRKKFWSSPPKRKEAPRARERERKRERERDEERKERTTNDEFRRGPERRVQAGVR